MKFLNIRKAKIKKNDDQSHDEHGYVCFGWGVLSLGFLGFLLWAGFAPLDKGVLSQGEVTVSGNRKTVQAPDVGIIDKILVKEGSVVKNGQVVIELNSVKVRAQVNTFLGQYYTALATEARLFAEKNSQDEINFPPALTNLSADAKVAEIIKLQNHILYSRQHGLKSEINSYKKSIEGLVLEVKELKNSLLKKKQQFNSLSEQVKNMEGLAGEGYIPRNRYLEVEQNFALVSSEIDEIKGRLGKSQGQLFEKEELINQRIADYQRDVGSQLAQVQTEALDYLNKLDSAEYALKNTEVLAPVDGTVVALNVFTIGGVVATGDHLLDILPSGAKLEIGARLNVELIDKVKKGLDVDLMFTSFNQNKTPKIPGEVSLISADRLIDPNDHKPYYQMQINVTPDGMEKLNGLDIKPGMPVQVFVKTGSRSLLSYLFKPILDRAYSSLSEE